MPPREPTSLQAPPGQECDALLDEGWDGTCRVVASALGTAAFVVEQRPLEDRRFEKRALVYVRSNDEWELALRAADDDGTEWTSFSLNVADLAGDGNEKGVISIRSGVPENLSIVVVETTGQVLIERDLVRGQARPASRGGVETWSAREDRTYTHEVIRYTDEGWVVLLSEVVLETDIPELPASDPNQF